MTMSGRVIEDASVTIPLDGSRCDADGIAQDGSSVGIAEGVARRAGSSRASWRGAIATFHRVASEYFCRVRVFLTFEENVMFRRNVLGVIVAVPCIRRRRRRNSREWRPRPHACRDDDQRPECQPDQGLRRRKPCLAADAVHSRQGRRRRQRTGRQAARRQTRGCRQQWFQQRCAVQARWGRAEVRQRRADHQRSGERGLWQRPSVRRRRHDRRLVRASSEFSAVA